MKPVSKEPVPCDAAGNELVYLGEDGHQKAKAALLSCLGCYCSYCERCGDLHVEHVIPKKIYPEVRHLWRNYLLGCSNCNSIKQQRDTLTTDWDCLFPDEVNTAWAFIYGPGALISVNPALSNVDQQRAQLTIEMVGLDRNPPPDPASKDLRWQNRDKTWQIASLALRNLQSRDSAEMRETILQLAENTGFFSIWWTVFGQDTDAERRAEMRRQLIDVCKAKRSCFHTDGSVKPTLSP